METEGKQEKKKIGKTNDGKELETENRKFICFVPLNRKFIYFVPLFSSALIFTLLNGFPFFKKKLLHGSLIHRTQLNAAVSGQVRGPPRTREEAGRIKKEKFWHKFSNFGRPKTLSSTFGIGFGLEL
jgi:hypothetical protein